MKTTSNTIRCLGLAVALLAIGGTALAQIIPGRYIAVLKTNLPDPSGTANALAAQHGLQLGHVYTRAIQGFAFAGSSAAAQALARRSEVVYVEPDQIYTAFQQSVPTGIQRCDADAVPGLFTGGNSVIDADVAVIDTGLDGTHPDLNVQSQGVRFYTNKKAVRSDSNWQDDNGHGTHVGGIIGARDNGMGVVGVAPGARLWAVKVLDTGGSGAVSVVLAGIDWVVQHADTFEVANMSLGGGFSQAINDAVKAGTQAGVVFVVAAGNSAWDAADYSPASEPTALTVSALDDNDGLPGGLGGLTTWGEYDDTLAWFSNYGELVDVCAPGVEIYSTYPVSMGGYATMSGTSMAAPHVTGAAALYIARHGLEKSAAGVESVCAAIRDSGWHAGHYAHFCDLIYYDGILDPFQEPLLNVASLLYWGGPANLLTAPTDATKVSGQTACQVGEAPSGTKSVEFYLDGEFLGQDTDGSDGWAFSWNTAAATDGSHTLAAVATDGSAQLAGEAVLLGVNNQSSLKPSVRITQPFDDPSDTNRVACSGLMNLAASAVDLGPVAGVDFYFGELPIGAGVMSGTGEWTVPWDTILLPDGPGELTAIATGSDGSRGVSEPTPVVVQNHSLHIGNVSFTKSREGGQWTVIATVMVHHAGHQPVAGATVYADWTPVWSVYGYADPIHVSAITGANGQCSFMQTFGKKYYAAMFEITSVELPGCYYDPTLNDVSTRFAINSP